MNVGLVLGALALGATFVLAISWFTGKTPAYRAANVTAVVVYLAIWIPLWLTSDPGAAMIAAAAATFAWFATRRLRQRSPHRDGAGTTR